MNTTKGLRHRPTYDQLVYYLYHQDKIKYPNRAATGILESFSGMFDKNIHPTDKALQLILDTEDRKIQAEVDLRERGVQADVDDYKKIYEAKFETPNYYLEGGSSKDIFNN
jgi:hypothetical protein